ncbi:uncharacterized protein LOC133524444 [Cydia pomonella]|uniref:uncharacterized protein LOC133524444 n=1 Tax=Cydia pomonella TaxID=82600 RepID=UPI002ADE3145|nr:uncharacterized protein LOC133524444 [Cydia pomonella]
MQMIPINDFPSTTSLWKIRFLLNSSHHKESRRPRTRLFYIKPGKALCRDIHVVARDQSTRPPKNSKTTMWPITVILCLCASALVVAIPIQSDKSIASEIGVSTSDMDPRLEIQIPQDEKGISQLPMELNMESVPSDRLKKRMKRSVMPRMCPKGKIRINGICMPRETCEETGDC